MEPDHIYMDQDGTYNCPHCLGKWKPRRRYLYWPIRFRFSTRLMAWFTWHGWQVGYDRVEQLVFGWTFHLGPLRICFGPDPDIPRFL